MSSTLSTTLVETWNRQSSTESETENYSLKWCLFKFRGCSNKNQNPGNAVHRWQREHPDYCLQKREEELYDIDMGPYPASSQHISSTFSLRYCLSF